MRIDAGDWVTPKGGKSLVKRLEGIVIRRWTDCLYKPLLFVKFPKLGDKIYLYHPDEVERI